MKKIVFATNNAHKLEEVREILQGKFEVLSLKDIDCHEELPETHETLEENSLEKAQYVYEHYGYDCFADDTGLEADALNGKPGVYSARYATISEGEWAATEESHDAEANMQKLLLLLRNVPEQERTAQFKTVVSLIKDGVMHQFCGIVCGMITTERHGEEGFGYDPIFRPYKEDPDHATPTTLLTQTFAQMSGKEKNAISHRGRAISKLAYFLLCNC